MSDKAVMTDEQLENAFEEIVTRYLNAHGATPVAIKLACEAGYKLALSAPPQEQGMGEPLIARAVDVLQRHIPPDGLSDHAALNELYSIFDGPEYRAYQAARSAQVEQQQDGHLAGGSESAPHLSEKTGYVLVPREKMESIISALDRGLGDTDITHLETDEEIKEQAPIQWACTQLSLLRGGG